MAFPRTFPTRSYGPLCPQTTHGPFHNCQASHRMGNYWTTKAANTAKAAKAAKMPPVGSVAMLAALAALILRMARSMPVVAYRLPAPSARMGFGHANPPHRGAAWRATRKRRTYFPTDHRHPPRTPICQPTSAGVRQRGEVLMVGISARQSLFGRCSRRATHAL